MTLDLERVQAAVVDYLGEEPEEDEAEARLCQAFCIECVRRVEQLSDGCEETEQAQELLEAWAAAEAFYQLMLTQEATTPQKISADGVTIDTPCSAERAATLAREKRRAALVVLGEGEFYFGSM